MPIILDGSDAIGDLGDAFAAKLTTPGAWTAYTCTLTASGSNPTLGAGGYVTAFFSQVGKAVFMRGVVSFGTGSTAGSGYYFIDFPVAAAAYSNAQPIGSFLVLDTSAGKRWLGQFIYTTPTVSAMQFQTDASGTDLVQHGTPFAWTDGDFILFSSVYEAA